MALNMWVAGWLGLYGVGLEFDSIYNVLFHQAPQLFDEISKLFAIFNLINMSKDWGLGIEYVLLWSRLHENA